MKKSVKLSDVRYGLFTASNVITGLSFTLKQAEIITDAIDDMTDEDKANAILELEFIEKRMDDLRVKLFGLQK